jgi:hypothetical protein
MIKHLFTLIESKPIFGYVLAAQGGIAGALVLFQKLTPVIGFASAVLGLVAATITVIIKVRQLREMKRK